MGFGYTENYRAFVVVGNVSEGVISNKVMGTRLITSYASTVSSETPNVYEVKGKWHLFFNWLRRGSKFQTKNEFLEALKNAVPNREGIPLSSNREELGTNYHEARNNLEKFVKKSRLKIHPVAIEPFVYP